MEVGQAGTENENSTGRAITDGQVMKTAYECWQDDRPAQWTDGSTTELKEQGWIEGRMTQVVHLVIYGDRARQGQTVAVIT